MKHKLFSQGQNQSNTGALRPPAIETMDQGESIFAASRDEISRRAYFSYVNQGSLPGHEVQHWLKAEAELIAERNLTRVHGFHN